MRTFQNPRKAGRVKICNRVSFEKCLYRLLLLKVRVNNVSWSMDVTELNWVHSLATWQNQFTGWYWVVVTKRAAFICRQVVWVAFML